MNKRAFVMEAEQLKLTDPAYLHASRWTSEQNADISEISEHEIRTSGCTARLREDL